MIAQNPAPASGGQQPPGVEPQHAVAGARQGGVVGGENHGEPARARELGDQRAEPLPGRRIQVAAACPLIAAT